MTWEDNGCKGKIARQGEDARCICIYLSLGALTTIMSDEYCPKRAPCDLLRKIIKYGCDIWPCQSQCEWHQVLTKANVMVGNKLFLAQQWTHGAESVLASKQKHCTQWDGDDLASLLQLGSRRCIYYNECDWFCNAKGCMAQRFNMPCWTSMFVVRIKVI